jgi:L-ascorbate metabolism protein UlaG (beta-lactamase superfamily)
VYVFVSHGHGDHYERGIFDWRGHPGIEYILGYDIADAPAGRRMSPGDTAVFGNLSVTAHASTDIGVSFLIDWTETGYRIFHAGDLNLWHWRDESTLREIEQAERSFYDAVAPLVGSPADVAFFPVDPRQGALYDAGATYFIAQTQPRFFIPMHWQGRADVAMDFARRAGEKRTRIIALTTPGETIAIEKGEDDESESPHAVRAEPLGETLENRNIITEG